MTTTTISLIILLLIFLCFVTQIIPLSITAVLGALAMMTFGIITPSEAIAGFASDTVIMVASVMVIGNSIFETGLAHKIGLTIRKFKAVSENERIFLITVSGLIMVLSAILSNTATLAIFLPLVASISVCSRKKITKKNCYMMMGIAAVLGGNLTLVGSTPQLIAQGILSETKGMPLLNFFDLTKGALPLAALFIIYSVTIGYFLEKKAFHFPEVEDAVSLINMEEPDINTKKCFISLAILIICVIGFLSEKFSLGTIALFCACLCIITGCISFQKAFTTMDWTTILVLADAIGFSSGLNKSGAISLLTEKLILLFGGEDASVFVLYAVLVIATSLVSNFVSNTATIAIMLPMGLSVSNSLGGNPMAMTIGLIVASNLAFATPIGTPPVTMTLCGGYRFKDYTLVGGLFNVIAIIYTVFAIPFLYGL